ncbi:hypothetical protein BDZ45DRAFT_696684 [Acephala macrosclerotiorum]|nr:hypothetical protein BDZ45DRAFT_696684 [Acephala macrosclerotiorum]
MRRLEKLKVKNGEKKRVHKSLKHALRSVWSQKSLNTLEEKLRRYQDETNDHLLVSFNSNLNDLMTQQANGFSSQDQNIHHALRPLHQDLAGIHRKPDIVSTDHTFGSKNYTPSRLHVPRSIDMYTNLTELNQQSSVRLLSRLDFSEKALRQGDISEAYGKTFNWVFNDQDSDQQDKPALRDSKEQRSNSIHWLQQESLSRNIYWIFGKAGSGKSAFMRYIARNRETYRHLKHWAGDASVQIVQHYFWCSGQKSQYSYNGILQSLLYDILQDRPAIAEAVFRSEWREILTATSGTCRMKQPTEWKFSTSRLERALKDVIDLTTRDFRLCLFIDGLDEFGRVTERILDLIEYVAGSPFVKVCVSSRPWSEFWVAFEAYPALLLDCSTDEDMNLYVYGKLYPKIAHLKQTDPKTTNLLVKSIMTKAAFSLACTRHKDRTARIGQRDRIHDLQQKVNMLPVNLNNSFVHFLEEVRRHYTNSNRDIFKKLKSSSPDSSPSSNDLVATARLRLPDQVDVSNVVSEACLELYLATTEVRVSAAIGLQ